ncbi:MAG: hypothetical protein M3348_08535, partial [Acidobacteriota bacterium]|nr:hypothetical protein [Acidobacteriota bacterium]
MFKKLIFVASLVVALAPAALGQNSNTNSAPSSGAARGRAAGTPKAGATAAQSGTQPQPSATPSSNTRTRRAAGRGAQGSADSAQTRAVRDAFDSLVDGIRRADADAVMKLFWNSPQLI